MTDGPRAGSPAPPPVRPPRPQPEGTAAVVQVTMVMVALVTLWTCVQLLFLSDIAHDRSQALLYQQYRTQLADLTAPIGPDDETGDPIPAGEPVALLSIPAIDLDEVVVEGTTSGVLQAGPGHKRDTVLPGQAGYSTVFGRSASYGGPFARITELEEGDVVHLVTSQGERDLRVVGVRREGDPLPTPLPEGGTRLTLVTAEGEGWLGALTPDTTVFVDAQSTDGAPAPAQADGVLPDNEEAMAKDTTALPLLALHLALLLAAALGVVLARQRWSAALVWVLASPVAIALAWSTTDVVVRLLPNLT